MTGKKQNKIDHTPSPPGGSRSGMGVSRKILEDDPINKPSHYRQTDWEAIEIIKKSMTEDEYQGYLRGNIMKYTMRYRYKKQPIEDLRKARWYLEELIKEVNNDERYFKNSQS